MTANKILAKPTGVNVNVGSDFSGNVNINNQEGTNNQQTNGNSNLCQNTLNGMSLEQVQQIVQLILQAMQNNNQMVMHAVQERNQRQAA